MISYPGEKKDECIESKNKSEHSKQKLFFLKDYCDPEEALILVICQHLKLKQIKKVFLLYECINKASRDSVREEVNSVNVQVADQYASTRNVSPCGWLILRMSWSGGMSCTQFFSACLNLEASQSLGACGEKRSLTKIWSSQCSVDKFRAAVSIWSAGGRER